ncbi:MAG: hypothetical protein V4710_03550 [Verrucomicrobiota bacterium]
MPAQPTPSIKLGYAATFHRDGTISYWNGCSQTWSREKAGCISEQNLASMSKEDRKRAIERANIYAE